MQTLLSKVTFVKDAPYRFFPVRVTVVPPSTEPNLGSIFSRRGVFVEL